MFFFLVLVIKYAHSRCNTDRQNQNISVMRFAAIHRCAREKVFFSFHLVKYLFRETMTEKQRAKQLISVAL